MKYNYIKVYGRMFNIFCCPMPTRILFTSVTLTKPLKSRS